mgnify:CR=1 FL=1
MPFLFFMVFVGTSGWNYRDWKGVFYPEDLKKREWFGYYAERFGTVEVNYTFYRWPSEEMVDKWHDECPAGFRMTLKAPRMITHLKKLKEVDGLVRDFYALGSRLKGKMGCFLFQLPPNMRFSDNNFAKLERFVKLLDGRKDNAIEFRDASWWRREVFDLLDEHRVGFVTVSGLGLPEDFVETGGLVYIRFHGDRYGGDYSRDVLRRYAERLKGSKARKAYVYFNNDKDGFAPKNALELKGML